MMDQQLDSFRRETRAWLEENCPPEMRQPVRDEEDVYWGGLNASFKNDAQNAWFEACLDHGYILPDSLTEYGGAVLTTDPGIAEIVRSLRSHGKGRHKYDNVRIGYNSRLDTLQAAI